MDGVATNTPTCYRTNPGGDVMPGYPRTRPERLAVAERRNAAMRMRAAGQSYEEIARQLGHKTASAAAQDVQRALAATAREASEELRELELQRLDQMWTKVMQVLERQHVTVSNGRVVTHDNQPVQDDGPTLAAIDRLLRIQERRARLLGLDAPARHEVVTLDAVEAEIQRLSQELGRAEADPAAGTQAAPG